jgi:hypothetical protein
MKPESACSGVVNFCKLFSNLSNAPASLWFLGR